MLQPVSVAALLDSIWIAPPDAVSKPVYTDTDELLMVQPVKLLKHSQ